MRAPCTDEDPSTFVAQYGLGSPRALGCTSVDEPMARMRVFDSITINPRFTHTLATPALQRPALVPSRRLAPRRARGEPLTRARNGGWPAFSKSRTVSPDLSACVNANLDTPPSTMRSRWVWLRPVYSHNTTTTAAADVPRARALTLLVSRYRFKA